MKILWQAGPIRSNKIGKDLRVRQQKTSLEKNSTWQWTKPNFQQETHLQLLGVLPGLFSEGCAPFVHQGINVYISGCFAIQLVVFSYMSHLRARLQL